MKAVSGFSLPKSQRLSSSILIGQVFGSKDVVKKFPIIIQYFWKEGAAEHQFMPVVSKKKFKKAVDRNRIKRQIRELWRLNNHLLSASAKEDSALVLAIIYVASEKLPYQEMEAAFKKSLNEIVQRTQTNL